MRKLTMGLLLSLILTGTSTLLYADALDAVPDQSYEDCGDQLSAANSQIKALQQKLQTTPKLQLVRRKPLTGNYVEGIAQAAEIKFVFNVVVEETQSVEEEGLIADVKNIRCVEQQRGNLSTGRDKNVLFPYDCSATLLVYRPVGFQLKWNYDSKTSEAQPNKDLMGEKGFN